MSSRKAVVKIRTLIRLATILLGMTLIGLLVLAIGAVSSKPNPSGQTKAEMSQVSMGLQLYRQEYGTYPEPTDNAELIQVLSKNNPRKLSFYTLSPSRNPDGVLLDGWSRPFVFEKIPDGFRIRSAGKDGVFGTRDDLQTDVSQQRLTLR